MKISFAGTPELAATVLTKLLDSPHTVISVFTQPDRPAGRGRKIVASAVKDLAIKHNLPVNQPATVNELSQVKQLSDVDALVVVAYGMLLPQNILDQPTYGCINVHTSLLPRWRGAAPIQRAIESGDLETGISIMQIDPGLDTGPVFEQAQCPISAEDTSESLMKKLAELGGTCLINVLDQIAEGTALAVPQDDTKATYAKKITKAEAELDWDTPAVILERKIRAFNPTPVVYTELNGIRLRIWEAELLNQEAQNEPGKIIACNKVGIDVATKEGVIRLLKIQPPGKRIQTIAEFLNGRPDFAT